MMTTARAEAPGPGSLHGPTKLGILSSVRCPGSVILALYDLARELRDNCLTFVGGFQSPVERDFLDILLRGSPRVIICPARGTGRMRVPASWKPHIAEGRLRIVSPFSDAEARPRRGLAERRNRFVAELSDAVLIGYATPGGAVDQLARELLAAGKTLYTIDDPANAALVALGAQPVTAQVLMKDLVSASRERNSIEG